MPTANLDDMDLLSAEDYARLPESQYGELVRGRLVREPRPGTRHAVVVAELTFWLRAYLRDHPIGTIVTEGGFLLQKAPPTVRGPDIAVVKAERMPDEMPEGFLEMAPDLAVEIVSPSTPAVALHEKTVEYLEHGTTAVWLVYPAGRSIVVHHDSGEGVVLAGDAVLVGGPVLPDFELPLVELFRCLGEV